MKLSGAPLVWDIDATGNVAPTVTPSSGVQTLTFNLANLEGRVDDLWPMVQAVWVRLTTTITQTSVATALNMDKAYQAIDSFRVYSPTLGDVLPQRSGQGAAVGLIDQVIAAGHKFPTPIAPQISSTAADYVVDLYYRIPFAHDGFERPQDGAIWAPLFEKGKIDVNVAPTTASLFQTNAALKATANTVRAWFEVLPQRDAQIHAPWKPVRYEFQSAGTQLKMFSFGNGDGLLGIQPGARMSFCAWLSNLNGLGGVNTIDKWSRFAATWRQRRVTVNPEAFMASYLAYQRQRASVGSIGSGTVNDTGCWPYQLGGGPANGVLDSSGLFLPFVYEGSIGHLSSAQKLIGDLQIDAGFTSNPNGTHVFRTHEHYAFKPDMVRKLVDMMGFDLKSYTAQPKLSDNSDPRDIDPKQLWGLPLRVVPRSAASMPYPGV